MRLAPVVLALAYPFLVHAAISAGSAGLTLAGAFVLLVLALWPGLVRARPWAFALLLAGGAALVALARSGGAALPLYLPPVLIPLFLAWLFGHTLMAGRMPLIERLARLVHDAGDAFDPGIPRYARRVTLLWTVVFVAMTASNLGLALAVVPDGLLSSFGVAPPLAVSARTWSLFANLLNYAFVALMFALEYAYRHRRFPERPYHGFTDFARRALTNAPALWRDLRRGA